MLDTLLDTRLAPSLRSERAGAKATGPAPRPLPPMTEAPSRLPDDTRFMPRRPNIRHLRRKRQPDGSVAGGVDPQRDAEEGRGRRRRGHGVVAVGAILAHDTLADQAGFIGGGPRRVI